MEAAKNSANEVEDLMREGDSVKGIREKRTQSDIDEITERITAKMPTVNMPSILRIDMDRAYGDD